MLVVFVLAMSWPLAVESSKSPWRGPHAPVAGIPDAGGVGRGRIAAAAVIHIDDRVVVAVEHRHAHPEDDLAAGVHVIFDLVIERGRPVVGRKDDVVALGVFDLAAEGDGCQVGVGARDQDGEVR